MNDRAKSVLGVLLMGAVGLLVATTFAGLLITRTLTTTTQIYAAMAIGLGTIVGTRFAYMRITGLTAANLRRTQLEFVLVSTRLTTLIAAIVLAIVLLLSALALIAGVREGNPLLALVFGLPLLALILLIRWGVSVGLRYLRRAGPL